MKVAITKYPGIGDFMLFYIVSESLGVNLYVAKAVFATLCFSVFYVLSLAAKRFGLQLRWPSL